MRETEKFPTLSMCEKRSTYFFLPSHRVKLDKSFINYVVARSLYMMVNGDDDGKSSLFHLPRDDFLNS